MSFFAELILFIFSQLFILFHFVASDYCCNNFPNSVIVAVTTVLNDVFSDESLIENCFAAYFFHSLFVYPLTPAMFIEMIIRSLFAGIINDFIGANINNHYLAAKVRELNKLSTKFYWLRFHPVTIFLGIFLKYLHSKLFAKKHKTFAFLSFHSPCSINEDINQQMSKFNSCLAAHKRKTCKGIWKIPISRHS